jgi:ABC-type glutathione transport system ATPase component
METILNVNNVSIVKPTHQNWQPLTQNVSFTVEPGKTIAILGRSGSGKTLTALAIAGLLPVHLAYLQGGEILFQNKNVLAMPEYQLQTIRAAQIAYLFQEPATAFNPIMTIGKQMDEILCRHTQLNRQQRQQRCLQGLAEVELSASCYDFYPHQLSGGMKQRALLAVMLLVEPKLLIADEVTSALDADTEKTILTLLKQLQAKRNFTVLLITHNKLVARDYADSVVVFYQGEVVETASAHDFFTHAKHPYSQQLLNSELKKEAKEIEQLTHPILEVENLIVDYPILKGAWRRRVGVTHAVRNVSFKLFPGRTLAIVGTSGSGKSSLAKALFSLVHSTCEKISWQGNKIACQQLLGKMQLIFQDPAAALNPRMTVKQILKENYHMDSHDNLSCQDKMRTVLSEVDLEQDILLRYPHEFSGGQRQRLCIARALMASSSVWVLDEATSALDSMVKAQILKLLTQLQQQKQLAYLFISHDWEAIRYMADDILMMQNGSFVSARKSSVDD